MHVYAPGVQGYIAIEWKMKDGAAQFYPVKYPAPEVLRLEVLKETAPVYRGHIRLVQDIGIGTEAQVQAALDERGDMALDGTLRYQACDDHQCYVPQTVPLKWTFSVEPLDWQRVPSEIQRSKPRP
jgi:hypothetical protein